MPRRVWKPLRLREMTADERTELTALSNARKAEARVVERAAILLGLADGEKPARLARRLGVSRITVYGRLRRFNRVGVRALHDDPRTGRPSTYTADQKAEVIAAALTKPDDLNLAVRVLDPGPAGGLPQGAQTDRHQAVPDRRVAAGRGAAVAVPGDVVREPRGPRVRPQKAAIETLYTAPPEGSVVVCLDEMGPESAKTFPGARVIDPAPAADRPAGRAKQEADYGRRGKGYVFGAFRPATGEALTHPYRRRTGENWIDFLERVERWVPAGVGRVYAVLDNLAAHRSSDVLLFNVAYPRWEFVFQPKYAAYLNLIEPWWKVLRSLALKGRRFETWDQIATAVEKATAYWNDHRHPFHWGRRRRHRPRRTAGVAATPSVR